MKKTVLFAALIFLGSMFFTGCPIDCGEDAVTVKGLEIGLPAPEEIQAGKTCRFEITGKLSGENDKGKKDIDFSSIEKYGLRVYVRNNDGVVQTCEIAGASGKARTSNPDETGYDYDVLKWYDNDKDVLFDMECYFYTPHFDEGNLNEWIDVKFNEPANNCYIEAYVDFYSRDEYFYGYFKSGKFNVLAAAAL